MTRWTLALLLMGSIGATPAEAGGGLFKHRGGTIASIPGTTAGYPLTPGYAQPSAYTAGGSSATAISGYPPQGGTYSSGYSSAPAAGTELINPNPPARPYSYYVPTPGGPRGYYGYGEDQFPYYGRAYGHPYDPWTWPYMTDSYANSLHHYYYPPVP